MRISDWSSDVCSSDLQRAPFEPGTERGEREGEIAFDMGIVDAARGALQRREILDVHIGGGQRLRLGREGKKADPVAELEPRIGQEQCCRHRAVAAWQAVHRLGTRPPAIARSDAATVALAPT